MTGYISRHGRAFALTIMAPDWSIDSCLPYHRERYDAETVVDRGHVVGTVEAPSRIALVELFRERVERKLAEPGNPRQLPALAALL